MAEEGVDRARKMVRRILFRVVKESDSRLRLMSCSRDHLSIYTLHGEPLFFQHFDGPYFPTLRLLHKCKSIAGFSFSLITVLADHPLLCGAMSQIRSSSHMSASTAARSAFSSQAHT